MAFNISRKNEKDAIQEVQSIDQHYKQELHYIQNERSESAGRLGQSFGKLLAKIIINKMKGN